MTCMTCMKRVFAALLAICLLLSGGLISAMAETNEEGLKMVDQALVSFEGSPVADSFNTSTEGFGGSFSYTNSQIIQGEGAIDGRSSRFNVGDIRWWNINFTGKVMGVSFDVLFDDNWKDTVIFFKVLNYVLDYDHSDMIIIRPDENGDPCLYNLNYEKICVLPRNQVCNIAAETVYGEKGYDLLVNGEVVAAGNQYSQDTAFYMVREMQFLVLPQTEGSQSYAVVDNIRAYALIRPNPQPHSFQEPGKIPTIELPEIPTVDGVAVYANETMISKPAAAADGAMLLPLEETMQGLGATATAHGDGSATIVTDKASFTLSADGKTLSWNDDKVTLNTPAAVVEGVLYAPGQVFAETLDAKVWYAEALEMIVVSTGKYKDDDLLRNIGASFWMNGQPYYEISYNKFDLQYQISYDPIFNNGEFVSAEWNTLERTMAGAEAALKELSENGFKTIRIFCTNLNPGRNEAEQKAYWDCTDAMYDLCDKYGIRVVFCLGLLSPEFVKGQQIEDGTWAWDALENYYDLVVRPESESRQNLYQFIDTYINRYKDRDTVLMWEIVNEGNLQADIGSGTSAHLSLLQLGNFYTDVANEIRKHDPDHMITSGDTSLRQAQWHLFSSVMKGGGQDWTLDTARDRLKALWMLNENLDALSIHGYGVGYNNNGGHMYYAEKKGTRVYTHLITWEFFLNEAKTLGIPLYNGECGGMMDENGNEALLTNVSPEGAVARERYLATLIEAGVQLTHWWTFRSDSPSNGINTWSITSEGTPESFVVIKEANEKLQAKYIVNPLDAENTHTLSTKEGDGAIPYVEETTVPDVTEAPTDALTTDAPNEGGCASVLGGGLVSIVMLGGLWLAVVARKRK